MLAKRIIPCLDVKNGLVVKGRNFRNLKYAGEPIRLAKAYANEGADEIVFLDITATVEKRKSNRAWINAVAKGLNVPFTVGGGISSTADIRDILTLGADKVAINTAAIKTPELIGEASRIFGSQCVVIAIDAKSGGSGWAVFSHAGTVATGRDAIQWALECEQRGAGEVLVTSIDRDGTRLGFDCALMKQLTDRLSIPVIASGGAGKPRDFLEVFSRGGADAALAAGIFHYKDLTIPKLKRYLSRKGIPMRLD